MESFRFESWPWLLLCPVVIACVYWSNRKRSAYVMFSSLIEIKHAPITIMQRLKSFLPWLTGVGMLLLLLGLARPQFGRSESRISGDGIAIQLVLDTSGSMEAIDFLLAGQDVNRLTAVKHVVKEFVLGSQSRDLPGRRDDLVGLVAFGGFADTKCPLTLDHGALVETVQALNTPKRLRDRRGRVVNEQAFLEEMATAIGDGLALGLSQLKESKAKSRVVILLTDGDNNAGVVDPREAASIAKQMGIKVYTIGIGRSGMVRIPQEDAFGQVTLVAAQFRVDEQLLKDIAQQTDGDYFHASETEGLARVYARINELEKSQLEEVKYSQYHEIFHWFVGSGLALLGAVRFLTATRFRTLT